jgi:hypothetical protein
MWQRGFGPAIALSVVLTTSAAAEDAETTNDLRCLVVASQMSASDNPSLKASALPAWLYYLGRLDGHNPKLDLEKSLIAELSKMTPQQLQAAAASCGNALAARGQVVTTMADDLVQRGQQLSRQTSGR